MSGKKRRFLLLLKGLVSVALVGWLVLLVDWRQFVDGVNRCDPVLLVAVEFFMAFLVFFSAVKWRMLLKMRGLDFSVQRLHRVYYIATFFNNFLPTNIGGDAIRVLYTLPGHAPIQIGSAPGEVRTFVEPGTKQNAGWQTSLAAVIVERLTGFIALLGICYLGATIQLLTPGSPEMFHWVFWAGTAGVVLLGGLRLVLGRDVLKRIVPDTLPLPGIIQGVAGKVLGFLKHLVSFRRPGQSMVPVWVVSLVFQALFVFMMTLLARAVGISVSLPVMLVIVPLQTLISTLPLAINGIGLSEAGYVFLFNAVGVPVEAALLMALVLRALLIPLSIIGGVVYLLDRSRSGRGGENGQGRDGPVVTRG